MAEIVKNIQAVEDQKNTADRSMYVAYLLDILLGFFGTHRFYLGYIKSGFAMLALTIITAATSILLYVIFLSIVKGAMTFGQFFTMNVGEIEDIMARNMTDQAAYAAFFSVAVWVLIFFWCFVDLFFIPRMLRRRQGKL